MSGDFDSEFEKPTSTRGWSAVLAVVVLGIVIALLLIWSTISGGGKPPSEELIVE